MDQVTMPKAAFDALMQQISALQATVDRLTATIEEKDRIIAEKIEIILNQNRTRFGQSSEKRTYLLCDGQLSLFEQSGDGITEKAPDGAASSEKKEVSVSAHTRKPKRTMEELCTNVPEETVIVDLPEEQKFTADGRPLKCIGTDDVRVELIREPSRVYKRVYRCKVYADPKAEEETGNADIRRPHVPAPLLPHSYASASVVTDIIVKKYADALPLYRQEQMWKRLGVELKRNTMANWVVLTAETYLKPFGDAFLAELLRQAVIHADETVLQVNKEPGREATAESRIWAYASSKRAERQIRYFRYMHYKKCSTHYIRRDELEPAVLAQLRADCAFAREHEDEFVKMVERKTRRQGDDAIRQGERDYADAKKRIEEIDQIINQLYEDKVSGSLSAERCSRMLTTYEAEQETLRSRCQELQAQITAARTTSDNAKQFIRVVRKFTEMQELTSEIVATLIERVEVGQAQVVEGVKKQEIKIIYNFIGNIQE